MKRKEDRKKITTEASTKRRKITIQLAPRVPATGEPANKSRNKIIINIKPKTNIELLRVNEINKHLSNARMILLNSNATPIRCYGGIGYKCSYCQTEFVEPKDLKAHTIQTHDDAAIKKFKSKTSMLSFVVKLDITDLSCKICKAGFDSLQDLIDHLVDKHDMVYHTDIKSHIIPFKFDSEKLKCVLCKKHFNNFKVLIEHMNIHFSNHVCEICGSGFVNKRTFYAHCYRHKTGVFECMTCNKVFDTKVKKQDHERAVHVSNKRNKCGYCGEMFGCYRKKKEHEVKMHGAKALVLKCLVCSKVFNDQRALTVHTKKKHLVETRVPNEGF